MHLYQPSSINGKLSHSMALATRQARTHSSDLTKRNPALRNQSDIIKELQHLRDWEAKKDILLRKMDQEFQREKEAEIRKKSQIEGQIKKKLIIIDSKSTAYKPDGKKQINSSKKYLPSKQEIFALDQYKHQSIEQYSYPVQLDSTKIIIKIEQNRLFTSLKNIYYENIVEVVYINSSEINVEQEKNRNRLRFQNSKQCKDFDRFFFLHFKEWQKKGNGRLFEGLFQNNPYKPSIFISPSKPGNSQFNSYVNQTVVNQSAPLSSAAPIAKLEDEDWLKQGVNCIKYAEGSFEPHKKKLFLSTDSEKIFWCDPKKKQDNKFILWHDILNIKVGRQTAGFLKFDKGKRPSLLQERSLTIMSKNEAKDERMLELQMQSREDRDRLIKTLEKVKLNPEKLFKRSLIHH